MILGGEKVPAMRTQRQRGMTIVEMVISIFLLTLVMLGALAFIPAARMANDRQRGTIVATNIARTTLEDLRRRDFLDAALTCSTTPVVSNVTVEGFSFQVSKTVRWLNASTGQVTNTADQDNKAVILLVQGTGRTSGIKVEERTVISRYQ